MGRRSFILLICIISLFALTFSGCAQENNEPLTEGQVSEQPVYKYETQELYAKRDDNQIYGVIYIPQNGGVRMPAVIYSHGFGGSH